MFCFDTIWIVADCMITYYIYASIHSIESFFSANHNIAIQYIPINMHTVFALLCFVVVIHWLIFPYPSGLLHWHCGNLTIAPVPAKQPWWIWINTSCEFIMNDCITTTKQSTTKPCAYFLGYTVGHRNSRGYLSLPSMSVASIHKHLTLNPVADWGSLICCYCFQNILRNPSLSIACRLASTTIELNLTYENQYNDVSLYSITNHTIKMHLEIEFSDTLMVLL